MHNRRSNKAIEIDFEAEHQKHVDYIKSQIGKPVPLSHAYTKGEHPILVSIDGDKAVVRYRNGAELSNIPIKDLNDNTGYWM